MLQRVLREEEDKALLRTTDEPPFLFSTFDTDLPRLGTTTYNIIHQI